MNIQQPPCRRQTIEQFLADQLSGEEQTAFEEHLDNCTVCRQCLDELAADGNLWQEARGYLSTINPSSGEVPSHSNGSSNGEEAAEFARNSLCGLKGFLSPTDDPHMLGRLGGYEVVGIVGSGGMGVVLKAFDAPLNRYVAIKVLGPQLAASGAARQRFAREAKAAAAVVHDNVMAIHGVSEANGLPYFVMPYVRGPSLEKRLRQSGAVAVDEILRIGMQIASGLAAAHAQGLVHRDIKPANILLEEGIARLWITDFGLARAVDDASLTRSGVIAGTPQYMSPEQAAGESVDHRSDLFSLGSVLYALCTGRPPFRADTTLAVLRRVEEDRPRPIRDINPEIPEWLARIVGKLQAKDPADRFQSATEVATLVAGFLAHLRQPTTVPAPELPPLPEPLLLDIEDNAPTVAVEISEQPRTRRHRWAVPALVALLAATVVGLELWWPWAVDTGGGPEIAPPPFPVPPAGLVQDYRGRRLPLEPIRLNGPDAESAVKYEDGGLRVALPAGRQPSGPVGIAMGPGVRGDFEITAGYELIHVEKPTTGYGVGFELYVMTATPTQEAVALSRCMRVAEGDVYMSARNTTVDGKRQYHQKFAQASGTTGKLRLTRKGREVAFWMAEVGGAFKELARYDLGPEDVKTIRFAALPGTGRNAVDLRITDLAISDSPSTAPVPTATPAVTAAIPATTAAPASPTQAPTGGWGWLATSELVGLIVTLSCVGLWAVARRRAGSAAVVSYDEPTVAVAAPIAFACPGCATPFKVKAEWAGKRSKCPKCGRAVLVPGTPIDQPAAPSRATPRPAPATGRQTATAGRSSRPLLVPAIALLAALGLGAVLIAVGLTGASADTTAGDVPAGNEVRVLRGHAGPIHNLRFASKNRLVSTSGWPQGDRTVRIWDTTTGAEVGRIQTPGEIHSLDLTPDGRFALVGQNNGHVLHIDLDNRRIAKTIRAHKQPADWVAFGPEGRAFSGSIDGTARMWNLEDGQELAQFKVENKWVRGGAVLAGGQALLTGDHDGLLQIWDTASKQEIKRIAIGPSIIDSIALAPGGRHALVSGGAGVRVIDLNDGREVRLFQADQEEVYQAALSPDGRTMLAASFDGAVRLWDFRSGKLLSVLGTHQALAFAVAYSPDGRLAASGGGGQKVDGGKFVPGGDFSIRLWPLAETPSGTVVAETGSGRRWLAALGVVVIGLASTVFGVYFYTRRGGPSDHAVAAEPAQIDDASPWDVGEHRSQPARSSRPRWPAVLAALLAIGLGSACYALTATDEKPADTTTVPETFAQDFRGSRPVPAGFAFFGETSGKYLKAEPEGMRITLPKTYIHPWGGAGIQGTQAFRGDFEITATVEVLHADVPKTGFGVGVSIRIEKVDPASGAASLCRVMKPTGQPVNFWDHTAPGPDGKTPRTAGGARPCPEIVGRLRLKREGRVLHYLWGPGATGDEFNFVHQIEFGDEDIRNIRLSALTGRQPCDVDVRLIDLKVRSAGSATTEARTNRWLVAAAVLMGVGLFVTLGVWLSNSRGGTVAPTLTTANDEPTVAAVVPEFITFACAGCGKKIVVKAEWAGKKGRCVHCHREMVVPTSQGDQPSAAPTTVQDDAPADGVPQPSASRLARTPIVPGALILVAVGALGTAAAVWFASAPGTAAATTAAQTEFYHSFKDNPAASRGFEFVGPGAERFVRYEPDGVRITLPAGLAGERPMTGIATPMGVRGDFEITASFEILREPATEDTGESGTRLSLGIFQDTPRANVASVTRSVGAKVGPAFVAWESLWNDETGKPDKKSKVVPTDAMAGRLRLVRTGSVLSYYVAKDSDRDFTLLQQYAFGTADLKEVRVTTSTGGPRAALDVRFTDLRVRAAALPYIPGAETPLRSWRGPVLVGAAAAVALALGAWLVVRRNSVRTVVAALILVLWTTASVCAEEKRAIDFRAGSPAVPSMKLYGADVGSLAKADAQGLRFSLPAGHPKAQRGIGLELPQRIRGNFQIELGYELLAVGDPVPEAGAGLQMHIAFDSPAQTTAMLTRLRKPPGQDKAKLFQMVSPRGETYGAFKIDRGPDGKEKYDGITVRAVATKGKLKLARVGSQVQFWVAEGESPYHQLRTRDVGTSDVTSVRVNAFSGDPPTAVDVRLTDLTISADEFPTGVPPRSARVAVAPDAGNRGRVVPPPLTVADDSADLPRSEGRWSLLLGIVAAVGLGLASVAWAYRVRRRGAPQPVTVAEAPASLTFACPGCKRQLRAPASVAGKKVKCPQCSAVVLAPAGGPNVRRRAANGITLPVVLILVTAVFGCSIYANRSFTVRNGSDYRFFPPFKPYVNVNMNSHLGAEYFNIAKAIVAGHGFADPFGPQTGPTAWMPPVLPAITAALLWFCDGDRDTVMAAVVFIQVYVLILTGLLVVAVAHRTTGRVGGLVALTIFLGGLISDFHSWFQFTHDCWLVLLALDLLIVALVWFRPLQDKVTAAGWGLLGGFCALTSPIVGFLWGAFTLASGFRRPTWSRFAVAALVAGLVVAPWTLRNYFVFGRLIPVKSNAAYELYQSQCLQPDGLIQGSTFAQHPYRAGSAEAREYAALGEIPYIDKKREQFWQAVAAEPLNFMDRLADRVLGTTVWYTPMDRAEPTKRPWVFWIARAMHPLPFLALLLLAGTAVRMPLSPAQWTVIGVYLLYLLPYMAVSYYPRYGTPLVGVKVLLVIWGVDRLLRLVPRRSARVERVASAAESVQPATAVRPRPQLARV